MLPPVCSDAKIKDKNYTYEIQQNKDNLQLIIASYNEIINKIDNLKKQINIVNEYIVTETSNIIRLDLTVPTNIESLKS